MVVVGEREDAFAGVCGADAEVVHPAGAAEGHLAFGVEPVVAQPVMTGRVAVARRGGFRGGAVGLARCSAVQSAVGAPLVVVLAELVELALELERLSGWWSGSEPALQGLVKALGLALGLGVAGGPVLLPDTEQRQDVFERVATAGEPAGVDAAVIGQRARRRPVLLDQAEEHGHDVIAGHGLMDGAGEQVAGVVIEPVQDLHVGPVREAPVDEVRLPHLVRLRHLKPRVGATGDVCAAAGLIRPA